MSYKFTLGGSVDYRFHICKAAVSLFSSMRGQRLFFMGLEDKLETFIWCQECTVDTEMRYPIPDKLGGITPLWTLELPNLVGSYQRPKKLNTYQPQSVKQLGFLKLKSESDKAAVQREKLI